MWDWKSRFVYRRLTAYLVPPVLAVWGVYSMIKLEFNCGDVHLKGPEALLAGLGLVAAGALVLWLNYVLDKFYSRNTTYYDP